MTSCKGGASRLGSAAHSLHSSNYFMHAKASVASIWGRAGEGEYIGEVAIKKRCAGDGAL